MQLMKILLFSTLVLIILALVVPKSHDDVFQLFAGIGIVLFIVDVIVYIVMIADSLEIYSNHRKYAVRYIELRKYWIYRQFIQPPPDDVLEWYNNRKEQDGYS